MAAATIARTPIGKTPRSSLASHIGFSDAIRKLYAEMREACACAYAPARFSFNTGASRGVGDYFGEVMPGRSRALRPGGRTAWRALEARLAIDKAAGQPGALAPADPAQPAASLPKRNFRGGCLNNHCLGKYNLDMHSIQDVDLSKATGCPFYRGDDYVVGDSIAYLLQQLMLSIRRDLERRLAPHGLTFAQWVPLWRLKTGQSRSSQEIACEVDIDAGAMTRLLDRLVAKGLIARNRSEIDRRVVNLALTATGEAVVELIPQVLADLNNAYLQGVGADEWLQLQSLLKRMLANGQVLQAAAAGGAVVTEEMS